MASQGWPAGEKTTLEAGRAEADLLHAQCACATKTHKKMRLFFFVQEEWKNKTGTCPTLVQENLGFQKGHQ